MEKAALIYKGQSAHPRTKWVKWLNGGKTNLMILSTLELLNSCDIVMVLSQLLLVKQAVIPVTQLLIPVKTTGVKAAPRTHANAANVQPQKQRREKSTSNQHFRFVSEAPSHSLPIFVLFQKPVMNNIRGWIQNGNTLVCGWINQVAVAHRFHSSPQLAKHWSVLEQNTDLQNSSWNCIVCGNVKNPSQWAWVPLGASPQLCVNGDATG